MAVASLFPAGLFRFEVLVEEGQHRFLDFGVFKEINELTVNCRKNRKLFAEVNPIVYKTIDDFSKLVAFFNYIDETEPDELDAFVKTLKPVLDRIPTLETPIAMPYRVR